MWLHPGDAARLIRIDGQPDGPLRWSLRSLDLGPNYVGALAVEGPIRRLLRWRWSAEAHLRPSSARPRRPTP